MEKAGESWAGSGGVGGVLGSGGAVGLGLVEGDELSEFVVVELEAELGGAGEPLGAEGDLVFGSGIHGAEGAAVREVGFDEVVEVVKAGGGDDF